MIGHCPLITGGFSEALIHSMASAPKIYGPPYLQISENIPYLISWRRSGGVAAQTDCSRNTI